MEQPKVLLCGKHDALLQAMRMSSFAAFEVAEDNGTTATRQDAEMVVILHNPPVFDGMPMLRTWRREYPQVPVVVATSDYTGATTRMIFKSGAMDVLELPADKERILACYEAYLPHRKPEKKVKKPGMLTSSQALMAAVTPGMLLALPGNVLASTPVTVFPQQHHIEQGIAGNSGGFSISFFGHFKIQFRGRAIEMTGQAKLLFACLAYHYPKALTKDYLAKVFWPDKFENAPESARRSLNVELAHIRSAFQEQAGIERGFIRFEQNAYRLQHPWEFESDVLKFRQLYKQVQEFQRQGAHVPEGILQEAIQLYSANFLDDLPADSYNWIDVERQHLSAVFEQIADLRSEQLFSKGNFWEALAVCSDILSRDVRMEAIHRRAMKCYAKLGMLHKVEAQYSLCSRMMEQEFQSKPSAETMRLYEEIRASG